MGWGILACEQALRGAVATGRKRKKSLHLRHSCINDFKARRTEYVVYTRTADENTLIRKNVQRSEPSNDGFCERDTPPDNRKGKGVKGSQATPLTCQLKSIII